jgi:hypothetical protein
MKVIFKLILTLFLIFGMTSFVGATLTDNLDGTVTDDDRGNGSALMWLQSPGPDLNFSDAVTWADSLVFAGYDNWRLPSALDFTTGLPDETWESLNNEFGNLYGSELGNPANESEIRPLTGYYDIWYWTGTVDPDSSGDAYAFFWSYDGLWLNQSSADRADMTTSSILHVTAVRDIGAAPVPQVPEPATILLVGAGLVGVGFLRKRFKK